MAILSKGNTFATGEQVTAAKLNNLVDNATFASDAVDNSTTALDGTGKIIVKDGGIAPAKISTGGPGWTTDGQVKLINSKSDISDFWGNGNNAAALFTPYGFLGSNGSFAVSLFANGYRNDSGGFTSLGSDGNSTASGIDLLPTGDILFRNGTPSGTTVPERIRIDSSGQTIIGQTTTPTGVAGSLFVSGRIGSLDTYNNNTTSSSANLVIQSTGLFQRSTSSARYKNNIEDYTKGINEVKLLRPVSFQSNNEDDNKTYAGLIAEEVHDAGLAEFVDYNEEGQPDAIHYSNMVSLLTKALQESIAKIEALEARVTALES